MAKDTTLVPKKIWKIWISENKKPAPEKFNVYTDTWKVNKEFEILDITNYCVSGSPFLAWAHEQKKYTLINHYLRCLLLHKFGGIYMDLDIECVRDLSPLLNHPLTLGLEDEDYINNAVIVAAPGHEFFERCMFYMDQFLFNKNEVELETGPRMFTKIARQYYGWKPGHQLYSEKLNVIAPEFFYPYHYTEEYSHDCITSNTYTIHHWAHSWSDLVSIIIPCYKQAEYLPDAIKSALNQTYKNIEVIVVNDGSPDATSLVARQFPVKLVEQKNKGLSGARNAGIKASSGKYILTLDADDKISPDFIKKCIGKGDIVSTYIQCFGDNNQTWKPPVAIPEFKHFIVHNCINCCSLFKRKVFDATGGFDENMKTGYEDWEFWTHAAKLGFKFHIVPERLFLYRRHGHTMFHDALKFHVKNVDYIRKKHTKKSFLESGKNFEDNIMNHEQFIKSKNKKL